MFFPKQPPSPATTFLDRPALLPYLLHSAALTALLLFNSHVQIALRLAQTLPLVSWTGAELLLSSGGEVRVGKAFVGWAVVWGLVSTVCWAVFLPPA